MKSPWPTKKLEEICEKIKAGGTPSRKTSRYWNGEIPFVKIEDLTSAKLYLENTQEKITQEGLENSNAWILPPNSVLFSIYGSIGEVAINKIPVATNQAILGLIPKKEIVDSKFLAYSLKKYGKYLVPYNIQSTQKNLTLEVVKNFKIPLPPLPIQQKIVKVLDTIQEAIDIYDKIIEKTKELKKSLMAELFKYGAPSFRKGRKLKKTEIGEIPEDWEVVRLGEVTSQIIDTPHKIPPKTSFGIPFISVNYMLNFPDTNFYIDKAKEGLEYVDLNEAREFLKRFIPEKNDILFSKWGTPGVAKLINTSEKFLGSCSLALIKPLTLKVNPFYLVYLLNSPVVRKQVDLLSPTSTRTEIHIGHIENLKLPLPPLPEQQEIAEILQTIDQKIEIEKKKKELYEELFKTMLNKIMSQEIDVEKINLE
jgi:type I restriction enzyme S subunit